MEEHEISSIENRDDDEEDAEQNADEEHQSLDHHAWTQTHRHAHIQDTSSDGLHLKNEYKLCL